MHARDGVGDHEPQSRTSWTFESTGIAALASPAVVERLRSFGYGAEPSSPDELAKLIDDEMAKNGELIRRIGLTPQ